MSTRDDDAAQALPDAGLDPQARDGHGLVVRDRRAVDTFCYSVPAVYSGISGAGHARVGVTGYTLVVLVGAASVAATILANLATPSLVSRSREPNDLAEFL